MKAALEALGSIKLAVIGMILLMLVVTACTLAEVRLGVYGAVEAWIRTFLVWGRVPGTALRLPVFPGGGLIGALLIVNLTASLLTRHRLEWRRCGLILTHLGVMVLVAGEFSTAFWARESLLSVEVGHSRNWAEIPRRFEFAVEEAGKPVTAIPSTMLGDGAVVANARLPVEFRVLRHSRNARLEMRRSTPSDELVATAGAGRKLYAVELPPVAGDDEDNAPAAFVEAVEGAKRRGIWLLSTALGPQLLEAKGRRLEVSLRPERAPLPFTITLKQFRHDVYPGTDIARNFSSLVRLSDPGRREDRDVLVWMNHPLRYRGLTLYQSSYGKGDTLSVFQVVRNPGWTLPYLACILVTIGLAWHFLLMLGRREP
jgi:hypothetical protein